MSWIVILISILVVEISSAQDYDLPYGLRVLTILNHPRQYSPFAVDFACIGDQNGDGFDDLMLSAWLWDAENFERIDTSQIHIYHGGEEMDNRPDVVFTSGVEREEVGWRINYLGNLMPDRPPFVSIKNTIDDEEGNIVFYDEARVALYEIEEEMDFGEEYIIRTDQENEHWLGYGWWRRPCDLNGDGFNDLLTSEPVDTSHSRLNIFFGGADFDTISDWSYTYEIAGRHAYTIDTHTGRDINGDGYDDLLVEAQREVRGRNVGSFWQLFLGGEDLDTIPDIQFNDDDEFEGYHLGSPRFLKDINGDGYDDWGTTYRLDAPADGYGYYIFWGSDEPSIIDFIRFEGEHGRGATSSPLIGGDFNGDGFGDLITGSEYGWHDAGAMTIHFGSPWYNGESSIIVRSAGETLGEEFYGLGDKFGAVGDYNCDGVDDFTCYTGTSVIVFAGNRDWQAGVSSKNITKSFSLIIAAHPNPFNSTTNVTYHLPTKSNINLSLYDISGHQVMTLLSGVRQAGEWSTTLNGSDLSSGVYFIRMNAGRESRMQKVVLMK